MDKIKITKAEFDELYTWSDEKEDKNDNIEKFDRGNSTITFEEYSKIKDQEDDNKWRLEEE